MRYIREISINPLEATRISTISTIGPIREWGASIKLTAPEPSIIHYTTDGTMPSLDSTVYEEEVCIGGDGLVYGTGLVSLRMLVKYDGKIIEVSPVMFIFDRPLLIYASMPFGSYEEAQEIELRSTAGSTIYYTLDGSHPITSNGHVAAKAVRYMGPIEVGNDHVNAIAVKDGFYSEVLQGEFKVEESALALSASHLEGDYSAPIAVRLTTNMDDGVVIRYTINGGSPLGSRAETYDSAVILGNTPGEVVLRAVATTGKQQSPSITKKYNFKE